MASAACESPLRRVAKELANKGNSPVEVNRLKSLLRKKIGEDGSTASSSSSPKKTATPRKEVKVKRGATVKLCSSCETHNKDVSAKPQGDNAKQLKVAKNADGEAVRKTRAAKKNAETEVQAQTANPADDANGPVEKKAAAKKPRETKKKAVTQGEKLGVPSTSGTVQSDAEGSALADSGTQAKGEAKPKRQRKKSEKSVQQNEPESSVVKEKGKRKEVLKVKVAAPKKKTKNVPDGIEKETFENMNVTDLVNSVHQEEDIEMQNADGKSSGTSKSKATKPGKGRKVNLAKNLTAESESANIDETSDKQIELSVDKATSSKSVTKTKGAVKSKVSRPKKTNKNIPQDNDKLPFNDMDVTDLVTSIQQEVIEKHLAAGMLGTSSSGAKSKATNTTKGRHISFENSVTPDSTLADANEPSDNLEGLSVADDAPKSKAKAKDATKVKSHLKKTAKNLPEDNPNAGFEDMDVTDLVNSIEERKEDTKKSNSSIKNKLRTAKAGVHNTDNSVTSNSTLNSMDKPSDNSKNDSHNGDVIEDSEDMFKDDSSIEKRMEAMNFSSSNKTAPKNKSILGNSSVHVSCPQGDNIHEKISPLILHSSFEDELSSFNIETNYEETPEVGITGTSAGEKINLSTSTNLSHDDFEGHSMGLNNVEERSANHPSIHNDETFFNGDLSNPAVGNIEVAANITLRTRINRKKNKTDSYKSVAQVNTSWNDGISFSTQKDNNDDMIEQVFNLNDDNQQPSTSDMELLTQVKPEPVDDVHGTSSQSLSNHESSIPSGSNEINVSKKKTQKKASTLAEPKSKAAKKSPAKTSKAVETNGQKSKNSKKDSAKESSNDAAQKPADKSVNKSSQQESESSPKKKKPRKHDETLCEKHKNSKKDDKIRAHRLAKEKKSDKQLKKDMKVAKAMAAMSDHFSRISIGTTIGTINELHIGKLSSSESDSSCECSTDCSCSDYTSESTSSGGNCKCYRCLMKQDDPSCSESSSSDDDDESSDESSSSESTSSASSSSSSDEEIRRPKRMCSSKSAKSAAKPTYKEKLEKFCSKYDLRSNSSRYGLRSKDK